MSIDWELKFKALQEELLSLQEVHLQTLRNFEWANGDINGDRFCPTCRFNKVAGHAYGCRLNMAINQMNAKIVSRKLNMMT